MTIILAMAPGAFVHAEKVATTPTQESATALISSQKPEGIEVEGVALNGKSVTVTGTGTSNAVISKFLRNLDSSGNFDGVELVSILATTRGAKHVVEYQLYLKIK
ncbi:PilN domain-containing protein [Tahibacter sp. UC22_41]|uniref:PilN domain-containing protein n=1 Tax=Tahibacter sp. UC22_41 TaxID=3350178 RepID=UPI0036DB4AEA